MAEEPEPPERPFELVSENRAHLKPSQHDLKRERAARALEIMSSPQLQTLTSNQIDAVIQDLDGHISFKKVKEIGRRHFKSQQKSASVRHDLIGFENESRSCLEMLPKARRGPGVEPKSEIYQFLAKPRMSPGIEQPEAWSICDPPDVIPDEEYADEDWDEQKPNWSKNNIKAERFRSRWKGQHQAQAKAYEDSDHIFPIVQHGKLTLTPEKHEVVYNPMSTSWDDSDLVIQQGPVWDDWLIKCRISSLALPNDIVRSLFCSWLYQLPEDPKVVNIFRLAFFDGTAMPDGVSSMFLPDLKHLPAPRNMKEELTRLHWHETTEGYVYNWGHTNQKRIKAEEEKKERLRRNAPHLAWLSLPPDSRVVPPNIYLRPAELYDSSYILDILNWYVEKSPLSEDVKPWNESDYEKLLDFCRGEKLPFVVAARRPEFRYSMNQIDPAVGFAYVRYHRYNKNADSQMGDLQVFVHRDSKRKHIGRALVDMVVSCFDATLRKSDDYRFDESGTVLYGAGYGRSLTTLVCALAYLPGAQSKCSWIKKWLQKDFGFHEKDVFEGARVKFGATYVFFPIFILGLVYLHSFLGLTFAMWPAKSTPCT